MNPLAPAVAVVADGWYRCVGDGRPRSGDAIEEVVLGVGIGKLIEDDELEIAGTGIRERHGDGNIERGEIVTHHAESEYM